MVAIFLGTLLPVPGLVPPLGWVSAPEMFWLISMSCCKLFTWASWLTYALGSVCAVGSWFFISVTSRVRKSLEDMLEDSGFDFPPASAALACMNGFTAVIAEVAAIIPLPFFPCFPASLKPLVGSFRTWAVFDAALPRSALGHDR